MVKDYINRTFISLDFGKTWDLVPEEHTPDFLNDLIEPREDEQENCVTCPARFLCEPAEFELRRIQISTN